MKNTYLRPSYRRMIDRLYKTEDCTDFQKELRFVMFNNWLQAKVTKEDKHQCSVCRGMDDESVDCENCNGTGYELSGKEKDLLSNVTNLAF